MGPNRTAVARWNRLVCDVRCTIGRILIRAGAAITEASVISHWGRDENDHWEFKRVLPRR